MNKYLTGCIPYYGGKQKLLKQIFKLTDGYNKFIDVFSGGCSVSLYAKLLNFNVFSNDRQFFCYELSRSLIENNMETLSDYDLTKIYSVKTDYSVFKGLDKELKKYLFLDQHIDFVLTSSYANNYLKIFHNEYKKSLINTLITHFMLYLAPYSSFNSDLNDLKDKTKASTMKMFKDILKPSIDIARHLVNRINNSIFVTNKLTKSFNLDAIDLLDQIKPSNYIIYLDPPYYGEHPYERLYNIIDRVLLNKQANISVFNKKTFKDFFIKLLYPGNKYIISYAGKAIDDIVDLVKSVFNNVDVLSFDYKYSLAGYTGEKVKETKEYLIIAQ